MRFQGRHFKDGISGIIFRGCYFRDGILVMVFHGWYFRDGISGMVFQWWYFRDSISGMVFQGKGLINKISGIGFQGCDLIFWDFHFYLWLGATNWARFHRASLIKPNKNQQNHNSIAMHEILSLDVIVLILTNDLSWQHTSIPAFGMLNDVYWESWECLCVVIKRP